MAATIWKGHLSFGLVSIPIKLFRAARAEKVHMHRLQRDTGSRVRQVFVPGATVPGATEGTVDQTMPRAVAQTGPALVAAKKQAPEQGGSPRNASAEVEGADRQNTASSERLIPSEIVKGYEFEKGKYVAFEPEELEKIAPETTSNMQLLEFVRFSEVDPVYLESSYYVAADKGGEKPYALLFETLRKTGYAAIAEFVMHRRDQTMILRPGKDGIIGHTLFYEDEVKREYAFHADSSLVSSKETELAEKLVEALATNFDPAKFKDKFRERLQEAIAAKIEAGVSDKVEPSAAKVSPVVDIMEALQASLKAVKKPVASAKQAEANQTPQKKKSSGKVMH
jgi:DNA end-binding protein Ku